MFWFWLFVILFFAVELAMMWKAIRQSDKNRFRHYEDDDDEKEPSGFWNSRHHDDGQDWDDYDRNASMDRDQYGYDLDDDYKTDDQPSSWDDFWG